MSDPIQTEIKFTM